MVGSTNCFKAFYIKTSKFGFQAKVNTYKKKAALLIFWPYLALQGFGRNYNSAKKMFRGQCNMMSSISFDDIAKPNDKILFQTLGSGAQVVRWVFSWQEN